MDPEPGSGVRGGTGFEGASPGLPPVLHWQGQRWILNAAPQLGPRILGLDETSQAPERKLPERPSSMGQRSARCGGSAPL